MEEAAQAAMLSVAFHMEHRRRHMKRSLAYGGKIAPYESQRFIRTNIHALKASVAQEGHARAGRYQRQMRGYRAFVPAPLPPDPPVRLAGDIQRLLSEADPGTFARAQSA